MNSPFKKLKPLKLFLTSTFLIFSLTSCSSVVKYVEDYDKPTDFVTEISSMINKSYPKIKSKMNKDDVVLVSNFVNVDKLQNNSRLGFLLSETLKNALSSKDILIKEVELSKNFKFGKQGLTVLSRNVREINTTLLKEKFAMVGTYSVTQNRLILFIKLIDLDTGNILNSVSSSIMINKEISKLETAPRRVYQPLTL